MKAILLSIITLIIISGITIGAIKDKKSMFALESCESNGVFYVSKKRHKLRNNETIFFDEAIRDRDTEVIFDIDTNYIIAKE